MTYKKPPRPSLTRTREDAERRYRECFAKWLRGETGHDNLNMALRSARRWGVSSIVLSWIRHEERERFAGRPNARGDMPHGV